MTATDTAAGTFSAPAIGETVGGERATAQPRDASAPADPAREALAGAPVELDQDAAPAFEAVPAAARPVRVVAVEEVPEVAAHLRELLRAASGLRLVATLTDGARVVEEVHDLHPDVVLVDILLQGRTKGPAVLQRLADAEPCVGTVAITLGAGGMADAPSVAADAHLAFPFGPFELARAIHGAHDAASLRDPAATSRVVTLFGAKGGVGRTTLAYNLAVMTSQMGLHTILVDGSLQYGDLRRLLRAPDALPSICDLPTSAIRISDLERAVIHAASDLDVLLAPARVEMAELVTGHDIERILGILRRTHQVIVVDTPTALNEPTLAFLDAADVVLEVLTTDAASVDSTRATAATFSEIGYAPGKVRYVVNRADATGGLTLAQVGRALGRPPEYQIASDWQLISSSNAEGVPFVGARPEARASQDLAALAADLLKVVGTPLRTPRAEAAAGR